MEIIITSWSTTDGWEYIQTRSGVYRRRIGNLGNFEQYTPTLNN